MHGAYNIQHYHEVEELRELWAYLADTNGLNFEILEELALTRWWLVGACEVSFNECIDVWMKICSMIRNSAPSDSASLKTPLAN